MYSKDMNLLTDRPFLPEVVDETNFISFLRSNAQYNSIVLEAFNKSNQIFYIHYIDGDNWGDSERWKSNHKEFNDTPNLLYEISTYKDCIWKYADEFVIIDFINHSEEIRNLVIPHDETFTTVIYKCDGNILSYDDIMNKVKTHMWKSKEIKRGDIYEYDNTSS